MAAKAGILFLSLAAFCVPALANVPRASSPLNEKPHQGVAGFAVASHRGPAIANALIATGIGRCLCDEGRRSRSTGKEWDAETGLYYFLARYLSSAQGRFTSPDPVFGTPDDPQSWNMYAYARNNPLLYTDPDGETYRICDADGKNCRDVSDEQFGKYQRESTGLRFQKGQIYAKNQDGSQTFIGSYKQTDVDLTSPQFIALSRGMQQSQGPVNVLAGASLAFVGVAGGVAAGGAVANALAPTFPEAAAFIPRAVMTFANKQAARAAIAGMGLTGPQAQEALRTISRATATSTVQIIRSGQQVIVSVTRMGRDGYQQVEKFIDQSGGVRVVQKGINAAGELTHYDIKR